MGNETNGIAETINNKTTNDCSCAIFIPTNINPLHQLSMCITEETL